MTNALRTAFILTGLALAGAGHAQAPAQSTQPVVVELFQSQGCSSCPPAIANVNAVAGKPGVVALLFAVDYWDNNAWKDTFSRADFTNRQWDYARGMKHADVATPQVVVNGRKDLIGDDAKALAEAMAATPKATVPITLNGNQVQVGQGPPPAGPADIWLVRYDPRAIRISIKGGENSGKTIAHKDIVRELIRVGRWSGKPVTATLPPPFDPSLKTAVLVQQPGGPILAAAG